MQNNDIQNQVPLVAPLIRCDGFNLRYLVKSDRPNRLARFGWIALIYNRIIEWFWPN